MERMLKLLEQNARLSVEELAAMLGVTAEEVALQMDQYRKDGVIRGFNTLIDWDKVDDSRVQAVIELRVRPKKDRGFDDVAAAVAAFDEVESLLLMSGGRWTTCWAPPPILCCAPTKKTASCSRTTSRRKGRRCFEHGL